MSIDFENLKNLPVLLRLPHLICLPSASESVEYTALYKLFFWFWFDSILWTLAEMFKIV